jgi:hypothetical protein
MGVYVCGVTSLKAAQTCIARGLDPAKKIQKIQDEYAAWAKSFTDMWNDITSHPTKTKEKCLI